MHVFILSIFSSEDSCFLQELVSSWLVIFTNLHMASRSLWSDVPLCKTNLGLICKSEKMDNLSHWDVN